MAEHAGDGAEAMVVWAMRNGLLGEWRRGLLRRLAASAHCGEAAPQQGTNPTYIFTEPSVGYRMEKGEGEEQEGETMPVRSCLRGGAAAIIRAVLTLPPTTEMEEPPTLEAQRLVGPKPGGSRSLSLY